MLIIRGLRLTHPLTFLFLRTLTGRYVSQKARISLPFSERVLVLYSQYNDPFLNLAYENWMYENVDLDNLDVLYFWENLPCVVIGRHQNPWLESNIKFLEENDVRLARRYSGGGAVYHDMGNLNITFLTKRSRYNRKYNLECIARALAEGWNLDVQISQRDDLLVDGIFKVSGSAAKLGKHASYHHCTLLCGVNLDMLKKSIIPSSVATNSRSTQSVSSHVINLKDIEPSLTSEDVISTIKQVYTQSYNQTPEVLCMDIFNDYFPDIHKIRRSLLTWEWIFGKTSPFTISHTILLPSGSKVKVTVEIKSGTITNVLLDPSTILLGHDIVINNYLTQLQFSSNNVAEAVEKCLCNVGEFQNDIVENDFKAILRFFLNII